MEQTFCTTAGNEMLRVNVVRYDAVHDEVVCVRAPCEHVRFRARERGVCDLA
jgi:hypothetical protein